MTRSRRKTSIIGNLNADSEQADKHHAHRNKRRLVRTLLQSGETDLVSIIDVRHVSSTWSFAKDGRSYFDADKHPHLMRK